MIKLRGWLTLAVALGIAGCAGGGGGNSSNSNAPQVNLSLSSTPSGQNVLPIIVDAGPLPATAPTVNVPYVSVTICSPGSTTNCKTIDHIIVDTGSSGLRIVSSALSSSLALTQQMFSSTETLDECLQFADGYSWGSVKSADVYLGGESVLSSLAIHVIGDTNITAPRICSNGLTSENTVQAFGGNGILGVSSFLQDSGLYYACSGTICLHVAIPQTEQIQNPVGLLASDNNGIVIDLPAVPATGATTVSGSLILGIGTRSNNAMGNAVVFALDPSTGNLTTMFNNQSYASSFFDSGSNGLFFPDSSIAVCSSSVSNGFYCPVSTSLLTATNQGTNGNNGTVNFNVANADSLFKNASYTAFSNLAGTSIGGYPGFDWGLPFFFGRTVFTAIEGRSSPGGSGPYVAY